MKKKDLNTTECILQFLLRLWCLMAPAHHRFRELLGVVTGDRQTDMLRHRFVKFEEKFSSLASKSSTAETKICLTAM